MFNWLSTVFPRRSTLRPAPHVQAVAIHNSYGWPNLAEAEAQSKLYQQSPWVYIAVNRIAEAAALVPLQVRSRLPNQVPTYTPAAPRSTPNPAVGAQHAAPLRMPSVPYAASSHNGDVDSLPCTRGRVGEGVRHPLETLLDAPNPYLSRFELIEQTLGMLELTGDAYWFLSGDSSGVPTEIWPLRTDRVSIVPDPTSYIKGYIYEIDGQRIPLTPLEVVHFKRWHPANDYYGLSALEAARVAVTSDRAMAEWNKNTFGKDNGVPAGVVTIKNTVSDGDFERIKREWRQSYGGPQRTTAFLRGGAVEWQNIGLNHNELDFLKGRQAHRDEILNIFGIPVGLVSENATEANAKVAERLFIERTLWPKLVRIAQKITQDLLPFWPGSYVAEFEDIRPTDTQARLDEIRTAYPVLSINEIRQRYYQLPATLWGRLPVGATKNLNQSDEPAASNGQTVGTTFLPSASDPLPVNGEGRGGVSANNRKSVGTAFLPSVSHLPSASDPLPVNGEGWGGVSASNRKSVGTAFLPSVSSKNATTTAPSQLQNLQNVSQFAPTDIDDIDDIDDFDDQRSDPFRGNSDIKPAAHHPALTELGQWERFALKRLGKSHRRPFQVRAIPPEVAFELSATLLAARTESEVQAAFAAAAAAINSAAAVTV